MLSAWSVLPSFGKDREPLSLLKVSYHPLETTGDHSLCLECATVLCKGLGALLSSRYVIPSFGKDQ